MTRAGSLGLSLGVALLFWGFVVLTHILGISEWRLLLGGALVISAMLVAWLVVVQWPDPEHATVRHAVLLNPGAATLFLGLGLMTSARAVSEAGWLPSPVETALYWLTRVGFIASLAFSLMLASRQRRVAVTPSRDDTSASYRNVRKRAWVAFPIMLVAELQVAAFLLHRDILPRTHWKLLIGFNLIILSAAIVWVLTALPTDAQYRDPRRVMLLNPCSAVFFLGVAILGSAARSLEPEWLPPSTLEIATEVAMVGMVASVLGSMVLGRRLVRKRKGS